MNPNPQFQQPPMQQPGFFKRNWKWLVPVGCIAPFLCCGVFGGVMYLGVSSAIKSSTAYVQAVAKAVANPEVRAALGEPITPGWQLQGEIKEDLSGGSSDFSVPLNGPKGKGTLRVVARKTGNAWDYSKLVVETADGKAIDLLGSLPPQKGDDVDDVIDDIEPDQVRVPDSLGKDDDDKDDKDDDKKDD